jgi:2-keto-4-pentenoate hydratase/2-oxohepta-3-ene-1,7-dioic acid hydratase in catechol pathway
MSEKADFWFAWARCEIGAREQLCLVLRQREGDTQVIDLATAGLALPVQNLEAALADWPRNGGALEALARQAAQQLEAGRLQPLAQNAYRLRAPYAPGRIFAAASNFREHAKEMGTKLAERSESQPYVFMKAETSVIADGEAVVKPAETARLDWEVELGVVIGKGGRHIGEKDALSHVAGYVVFNDISARDLNRRSDYPFTHDWFRGKSFDTFGPMGPWLVPASCIGDPQNLRMTLDLNGERMQDGNTGEMIFNIAEQIAYLSRILLLKPGDLIATGTPTGVGMGRNLYLKPGDVMHAAIEGIGGITNPVVEEEKR